MTIKRRSLCGAHPTSVFRWPARDGYCEHGFPLSNSDLRIAKNRDDVAALRARVEKLEPIADWGATRAAVLDVLTKNPYFDTRYAADTTEHLLDVLLGSATAETDYLERLSDPKDVLCRVREALMDRWPEMEDEPDEGVDVALYEILQAVAKVI